MFAPARRAARVRMHRLPASHIKRPARRVTLPLCCMHEAHPRPDKPPPCYAPVHVRIGRRQRARRQRLQELVQRRVQLVQDVHGKAQQLVQVEHGSLCVAGQVKHGWSNITDQTRQHQVWQEPSVRCWSNTAACRLQMAWQVIQHFDEPPRGRHFKDNRADAHVEPGSSFQYTVKQGSSLSTLNCVACLGAPGTWRRLANYMATA